MSTAYDKMTRAERRVAIAKDVIKHIKAQQLRVRGGYGYCVHDDHSAGLVRAFSKGKTDRESVDRLKGECTVCARGAMMLCKVAKFNHYDMHNLSYISQHMTTEALQDAFSENQLNSIEAAFECNGDGDSWYELIENDEDRLLAIMQNIVDHNGTFKPQVAYEVIG